MNKDLRLNLILFIGIAVLFSGCSDPYPEAPYSPDISDEAEGPWADVLSSDSGYPDNVYLTENVIFNPGKVGSARAASSSAYYDAEGYPIAGTENGACGPPEGLTAVYSNPDADMTVLGSGGEAVWRFDPAWVIIDGPGDDFITFSNHNVLNGVPDSSWNELGHIYVSADGVSWYRNSNEAYIENTTPGVSTGGYDWDAVTGLHGNNHTWANFRKDVEAEELDPSTGIYETVVDSSGNTVYISKYFDAQDSDLSPYLGGDRFDLADFVSMDSGDAWPAGGKMSYLKLVDDPSVLDGQDYSPEWMTGARLMSAMGINVEAAP